MRSLGVGAAGAEGTGVGVGCPGRTGAGVGIMVGIMDGPKGVVLHCLRVMGLRLTSQTNWAGLDGRKAARQA